MKDRWSIKGGLALLMLGALSSTLLAERHPNKNPEFLAEHGYAVTLEGMVGALKDPEAEVRDRAAGELTNRKMVAAIPALKHALATEKDPEMQVNLAYDLAQLGDGSGLVALKNFCDTAPPSPRLKATLYMLRFEDESCLSSVKSVLRSHPESDHLYVATALSLIPSFHHLGTSDKRELFILTVKQLADPTPYIRLTASQTLGKMESSDVRPTLEKAIADETDQVVRSMMQAELEKLNAEQRH